MKVTKTGLIVIIGDHFSKDVIKKEVDKIKHSSAVIVVNASEYKPIIKECFTKGVYVSKITDEFTTEYYIAALLVNVNKFNSNIKSFIRVDEQYLLSSKNAFKVFPTYLLYANSYCGSTKDRMFNFYSLTIDNKKDPKYFGGISGTTLISEDSLKDIIESFDALSKYSETKSPCAEASLCEPIYEVSNINTNINSLTEDKVLVKIYDNPIMLLLLV